MRLLRQVVAVLAMSCAVVPGWASTLTEHQAVAYALENSGSLELAATDLAMQARSDRYGWNGLLPTVQATATLNRNNAVPASLSGLYQNPYVSFVGGISASWNFNPALITNIELSHKQYEAGMISYEQQRQQTIRDVRKMFYGLLLQQMSIDLQRESLDMTKARLDQAQENFQAGYVPELTVLQARTIYDNAVASLLKQEQAFLQQKRTFAMLLGMPVDETYSLDGDISTDFFEIDSASLLSSLDGRFDISSLAKQAEVLKVQEKALRQQINVPTLSLSASYQPVVMDVSKDWGGTIAPTVKNYSDNGGVSVTVAMNLTNFLPASSARQGLQDVRENISKLALSGYVLRQNATVEILNLIASLEQSRLAIENSDRSIELARKVYDLTEQSYRYGATELLDVRDAQMQLDQAKLGKLRIC